MLDRLSSSVSCTFFSKDPYRLEQIDISMPTGLSSRRMQLRETCTNFALDCGYTHFAMPDLPQQGDAWLIYTHDREVGVFLARLPSRDAAEMWMLHRG